MNIIAEVKRRHCVSKDNKESISSIVLSLRISRPTVKKHLKTQVELGYQRQ